ncbi:MULTISPECIES: hypothetical protein [unclassified Methylobacterium]|uniref:hypothetical protein n=1 Tax=unclassified Methylobacterium TaxID=2615210 RepID=UPI002269CC59|nr:MULTISPECIES: hypothetical protein [unclassified Methylobacterium]
MNEAQREEVISLAEYLEEQAAKGCDGVDIGLTDAGLAAKALRVMAEIFGQGLVAPSPETG